jgi:hypothetical protein
MRYLCTIYSHETTVAGKKGFFGTEPSDGPPVARVLVSGSSLREAAASAYVRCVGQERARWLRQSTQAPAQVIAQETNRKAIAASLRKVHRRFGECYEMDNLVDAWSIKVDPVPTTRLPRRLRLSNPLLYHYSRTSSPN